MAIYNAGGGKFAPGSFLDKTTQDLRDTLEGGVLGAFEFAQQFLKQLPAGAHGTLIFTGATMSIRGGANFSAMAAGKAATRSLAQVRVNAQNRHRFGIGSLTHFFSFGSLLRQSLAREFHPKGVHVAHTIIDGLIGKFPQLSYLSLVLLLLTLTISHIFGNLTDTERVRGMVGDTKGEGTRLDPNEIGKAYLYLHNQHPSVWTQEMDLR